MILDFVWMIMNWFLGIVVPGMALGFAVGFGGYIGVELADKLLTKLYE